MEYFFRVGHVLNYFRGINPCKFKISKEMVTLDVNQAGWLRAHYTPPLTNKSFQVNVS